MKDLEQLRVWQKGMQIVVQSYALIQYFPKDEQYGLVSQIKRAAVSIPANIAEGSAKGQQRMGPGFFR